MPKLTTLAKLMQQYNLTRIQIPTELGLLVMEMGAPKTDPAQDLQVIPSEIPDDDRPISFINSKE